MDRTERFYRIHQLLAARHTAVPIQVFLEELEVSLATFKRDLEYLRDRLHAPILWDRERQGYCYDEDDTSHPFELPGMWFNASELHALLVMEHLLENLQPGLLAPHIQPLQNQIRALLDKSDHSIEEIHHRIRILPMAARRMQLKPFEILCAGLLSRKRLRISHYSRQRDVLMERDISPQRLVHYRDNWYLDSWCHLSKDIRTFSVDAIQKAELLATAAKDIPDKELDEIFSSRLRDLFGKNDKDSETPVYARSGALGITGRMAPGAGEPRGQRRFLSFARLLQRRPGTPHGYPEVRARRGSAGASIPAEDRKGAITGFVGSVWLAPQNQVSRAVGQVCDLP
jgi:Predicted transcriptional regulator